MDKLGANDDGVKFLIEEYKLVWSQAERHVTQQALINQVAIVTTLSAFGYAFSKVPRVDIIFAIAPIFLASAMMFLLYKGLHWNFCMMRLISIERKVNTNTGATLAWAAISALSIHAGVVPDAHNHYHLPQLRNTLLRFFFFIGLIHIAGAAASIYLWITSLDGIIAQVLWLGVYALIFIYIALLLWDSQRYAAKVKKYLNPNTR